MVLSNSQYNAIMRAYNQKQLRNKHKQDERVRKVYEQTPQIRDLEQEISTRVVQCARRLLDGDESAKEGLKQWIEDLREQKEILSESAGFSKDYMEMHYSCLDCRDTGYTGGKRRHCFEQEQIKPLYTQFNIDKTIETENFDISSLECFDNQEIVPEIQMTVADYMKQVLGWCWEFMDSFRTEGGSLIFTGSTGMGKILLTNCITRKPIQAYQLVICLLANDLFDVFSKNKFDYELELEMQDTYQYILDCDLLIIDDSGAELNNTFVPSRPFYCTSERLLRKEGTIISTNPSVTMLRGTCSGRVLPRIMSQYTTIPLYGNDIRMKKH